IITLRKELDIIENYLQLEKNRFNDDFSFEIENKENPLLQTIHVPPLLLQPFVENAIWHGLLLSSKKEKMLHIKVEFTSDNVKIIIDDNGIGRQKSSSLPEKKLNKS